MKQLYPKYSVDFRRFSIPDDISSAFSHFSLRSDEEGNQDSAGSSGDDKN